MTIEELLVYGKKNIHSDHAKILLAELIHKNPLEILMYLNENVPKDIEQRYKQAIDALKTGQPIQYVIGMLTFMVLILKLIKTF